MKNCNTVKSDFVQMQVENYVSIQLAIWLTVAPCYTIDRRRSHPNNNKMCITVKFYYKTAN